MTPALLVIAFLCAAGLKRKYAAMSRAPPPPQQERDAQRSVWVSLFSMDGVHQMEQRMEGFFCIICNLRCRSFAVGGWVDGGSMCMGKIFCQRRQSIEWDALLGCCGNAFFEALPALLSPARCQSAPGAVPGRHIYHSRPGWMLGGPRLLKGWLC